MLTRDRRPPGELDWGEALREGERLLREGRAAESLACFRRAIEDNPGEAGTASSLAAARAGLAAALDRLGRRREAARVQRGATPGGVKRTLGPLLIVAAALSPLLLMLVDVPKLLRLLPRREEPRIQVSLAPGGEAEVGIEFDDPFDVSAAGAAVEAATPENRPGAWEGYVKEANEIRLPGRAAGVRYFIAETRLAGKYGAATLRLAAGPDTPPGTYRIWLSGVYLHHVRRKGAGDTRTPNDPILTMAGDPLDPTTTTPWHGGQIIPVVEVVVR